MATPLEKHLVNRVKSGEKIGVDAFMHTALLDPEHGYYTTRNVFGTSGDFITAPDISQIFGEVCAAYLAINIGKSTYEWPALVELGPGRGALMRDMLRSFAAMPADHQPGEVMMVEASEKLAATQQHALGGSMLPIQWKRNIHALPQKPCFIIANEFLDALPIRQFVHEEQETKERVLGTKDDALIFKTDTPNHIPSKLESLIRASKHQDGADTANILEYPEAAIHVMQELSAHLNTHGGMMVLVDYGYREYTFGDSLQALKDHQYVDILSDIGEADITAHVNFALMRDAAEAAGLNTHILTTQGQFLRALGGELRAHNLCQDATAEQKKHIVSGLTRLTSPAQMGELFKVLVVASPTMHVLDVGL